MPITPAILRRPHIFISFKTEERESAAGLKAALEAGGFAVWWQESIQCGREWHGDIDAALLSAGCVVVLWSDASIASPWVRHEASQAVARGIYTPVRLSPMEIGSPFDRIQATDLFGWKGEPNHPGLLRLLARANELIPKPLTRSQRAASFLARNKLALVSSAVALLAIAMLARLSLGLQTQLVAQTEIAQSIQRTLHPLSDIRVTAFITVDPEVSGVQSYLERLRQAIPLSDSGALIPSARLPRGVWPTRTTSAGTEGFSIALGSDLWPVDTSTSWLDTVARYAELQIGFSRPRPIRPGKPDLLFTVGAYDPDRSEGERNTASIEWEIATGELTLKFTDVASKQYWESNGEIASVPDLEESTIEVQIASVMYSPFNETIPASDTKENRRGLILSTVILEVSGRTVLIRGSAMRSAIGLEGMRSYAGEMKQIAKKL